jgi:hypothetical protein
VGCLGWVLTTIASASLAVAGRPKTERECNQQGPHRALLGSTLISVGESAGGLDGQGIGAAIDGAGEAASAMCAGVASPWLTVRVPPKLA